jgi:uncharacterized membrane protein HdeD (DUF308 family)
MNPDVTGPATLGRSILQRGAGRWWWAPLIGAVIWFIIAWLVLRADYRSLATVGVLVGVVFLITAVNEVALAGVMRGGWAVLHGVLAVLFVLGAIWAFVRPVNTFFALASVLGLLLFLEGLLTLTRGIALRDESRYWGLEVVTGGLLILLAISVSTSDRAWNLANRAVFILLFVGIMAVFRGISDIALAFSLYRFSKEGELPQRAEAGADAAPPIPSQERREPARDTAAERAPGS